jgi:hypothetical protein
MRIADDTKLPHLKRRKEKKVSELLKYGGELIIWRVGANDAGLK